MKRRDFITLLGGPQHGPRAMSADVVVEGQGRETLRLFGIPYAVARVRAAIFNAAVTWTPIDLD